MRNSKSKTKTGTIAGSRAACTAQNLGLIALHDCNAIEAAENFFRTRKPRNARKPRAHDATRANPAAEFTPEKSRRGAAVRARIAAEKLGDVLLGIEAAEKEARRARRARINPRRMRRAVATLRAIANRAARKAQAKQAGGAREFGDRFLPEFAEEFTSGALTAWALGETRGGIIRAAYDQTNRLFSKMATARAEDSGALLSLPVEIIGEEFETGARMLSETRRGIILRALELRAKIKAARALDLRAAEEKSGIARHGATRAAEKAFARDARIIRRAALCALARLKGQPFTFEMARGADRPGRRGGRAPETVTAWGRMLAQHEATRARLGLAPLSPLERSGARD